ncbi:hypothetical protein [Streptomyces nigrescens]
MELTFTADMPLSLLLLLLLLAVIHHDPEVRARAAALLRLLFRG